MFFLRSAFFLAIGFLIVAPRGADFASDAAAIQHFATGQAAAAVQTIATKQIGAAFPTPPSESLTRLPADVVVEQAKSANTAPVPMPRPVWL